MPQSLALNANDYIENPTYFSQILKADLDDLDFPHKSVLIQYVDNLLLCSNSLINSQQGTLYLLQKVALKGHKVSKEKLQFCNTSVKYLGHRISKEELLIDLDRVKGILAFPTPNTKKQLRGFLGLAVYCRNWDSKFFFNSSATT